jgi:hypothetical protein
MAAKCFSFGWSFLARGCSGGGELLKRLMLRLRPRCDIPTIAHTSTAYLQRDAAGRSGRGADAERNQTVYDIDEIPDIPDQSQRIQEVTVDCYNQAEELCAFEVYFNDAMQFPFPAAWRDPDEPGHAETVTVLGVDSVDQRRGVLLSIKRGDKERRLLAEQVWAHDEKSANATVLDDYRYWVEKLNGLTPGFG